MQRSRSKPSLRIHIRTFFDQQFDDFLVAFENRSMQRSLATPILRIQIRTSIQVLFDGFDVSIPSSIK